MLVFPSGAVLMVEEENMPCIKPGTVIANKFLDKDIDPSSFVRAAMHPPGLVGTVNRPGTIQVGDRVQICAYQSNKLAVGV